MTRVFVMMIINGLASVIPFDFKVKVKVRTRVRIKVMFRVIVKIKCPPNLSSSFLPL